MPLTKIFERRQKPSESVEEFITYMRYQAREAELTEKQTMQAILNGVSNELRTSIIHSDPKCIEDLVKAATRAEIAIKPNDRNVGSSINDSAIRKLEGDIQKLTESVSHLAAATHAHVNAAQFSYHKQKSERPSSENYYRSQNRNMVRSKENITKN